jgi:hypothetical protein
MDVSEDIEQLVTGAGKLEAAIRKHFQRQMESQLGAIGQRLGWPEDSPGLPSVGWLASHTSLEKLYGFLYAATSKGVHFSPSEAARSRRTRDSTPNSAITPIAEPYRWYRTAFSDEANQAMLDAAGAHWLGRADPHCFGV